MGRSRVLSFMSAFSSKDRSSRPSSPVERTPIERVPTDRFSKRATHDVHSDAPPRTPPSQQQQSTAESRESPITRQRTTSRPASMVSAYQPPLMEVTQDTLPELQPIFTFLNTHANKLYQEGYFLKLDDQNALGKPNADRTWTECFAQLVGTVLSLWDAAELDAAGEDGEVLPKFINLTDASIKMIEALPTRNNVDQPLQNVLSISTAGKNRYLLHFNSHHSLIQWTAGIRLAMYEYATLQEAYTGALIAGKGKQLNNINLIMERNKFIVGDWVRVRFGAGTPWRRCWCIIVPPPEKEFNKLQKEMNKKKSAYDRSRPTVLKGEIRFYDTKKVKKVLPIATLTDAYCAYAIYPQSKPLIDQSTLIKIEGSITIHSNPPSSTEGFVFVMPEVHPAVTGFEMMLRWLFPAMDTFALYGRPGKLIADTTNAQGLMFAMPTERRYGYLEILDVTSLILTDGSQKWSEEQWRKGMKEMTAKRMAAIANGSRQSGRFSMSSQRRPTRHSIGGLDRRGLNLSDSSSVKSTPSIRFGSAPARDNGPFSVPPRTGTAPPSFVPSGASRHQRAVSEAQGTNLYAGITGFDGAPAQLQTEYIAAPVANNKYHTLMSSTPERISLDEERVMVGTPVQELQDFRAFKSVEPVAAPPKFAHPAGTLPPVTPFQSPEARQANNRMSQSTFAQMVDPPVYNPGDLPRLSQDQAYRNSEDMGQSGVEHPIINERAMNANDRRHEGLVTSDRQFFKASQSSDQKPPQPYMAYATHQPPEQNLNADPTTSQPTETHPDAQVDRSRSSVARKPLPIPPQDTGSPNNNERGVYLARNRNSTIRKPVRSPSPGDAPAFSSPSVIDKAAFDLIVPRDMGSQTPIVRQPSMASHYDDQPDSVTARVAALYYKHPVEKPRTGVLRTVGSEDTAPPLPVTDIPEVDFGPTYNYAAVPHETSSPRSLGFSGAHSSGQPLQLRDLSGLDTEQRPSSKGSYGDEQMQPRYPPRQESRQMAWQPGMTASRPSQVITPEQFVQQRAAVVSPQYAHHRVNSSTNVRTTTPPSPLRPGNQRHSSYNDPRAAMHTRAVPVGGLGNGDVSNSLSAREREHMARLTGQPLVNIATSRTSAHSPNVGLLGTIETREREHKLMKSELNSAAVEQQIRQQREQQALYGNTWYAQQQQAQASQYYGQDPRYAQLETQQQRNQPMTVGAQSMYAQSAGWGSTPQLGQQRTPDESSQQRQYFTQANRGFRHPQ